MLFGKTVGTAPGFRRFWAGIPKVSRYRDPSVSKESSVKCLEHKRELVEGPFQSFLYRFTALVHRRRIFSSVGKECKLYPIPLVVLQSAATQRRGIAKDLTIVRDSDDKLSCSRTTAFVITYTSARGDVS